jgi:hypothetical protein
VYNKMQKQIMGLAVSVYDTLLFALLSQSMIKILFRFFVYVFVVSEKDFLDYRLSASKKALGAVILSSGKYC